MTGSSRHKATLLAILLIILGAVAALALLLFHEKSPLKHLLSDNQENAAPMHTTAADLVRAVDDQFTPGYLPEGAAQTFEAFSSDATAIAGNDIRLKMTLRRWLEASASQFQALTAVRLTCEGDADRTPLCMQAQSQLTREANQASHLREQVCAIVPCPTHPSDTIDGSPEPAG